MKFYSRFVKISRVGQKFQKIPFFAKFSIYFSYNDHSGPLWSFFKNYVQNQNKEFKFAKF